MEDVMTTDLASNDGKYIQIKDASDAEVGCCALALRVKSRRNLDGHEDPTKDGKWDMDEDSDSDSDDEDEHDMHHDMDHDMDHDMHHDDGMMDGMNEMWGGASTLVVSSAFALAAALAF